MRVLSRRLASRIALEERRRVMDSWQSDLAESYPLLKTVGSVERHARHIEWGGRILWALLMACMAVAINYVIFVRMLHYQFEFWRFGL